LADGELFYGSAIGHKAMVRAEVSWRAVAPLLGWRHSLDGLDEGEFTEGHELPGKWKIAERMIGRRLSAGGGEEVVR
jgi:hypothetical protein